MSSRMPPLSSSGTFQSTRTSTRFPATPISRIVFLRTAPNPWLQVLVRRQLQPPARLRLHRLAVPGHRVVLHPAPRAHHVIVVPAPRMPRLTRRQYRLAAIEVVQVDDLPPARREAVQIVT